MDLEAVGPSSPAAALPLRSGDVRVLPPRHINTSIYLDLNHFARLTPWAHGFMHVYALWLGPVLLTAVFLAVYALAWWRRAGRVVAVLFLGGAGTLIAFGLNQLVGDAARELRPYDTYRYALVLVARTSDYSFPSDHSIVAGGLTLSVLLVLGGRIWRGDRPPRGARALAGLAVAAGLFLCFGRVYVGAHYPGDVVAGYLLSSLVVVVVVLVGRPLAFRAVDRLDPTVLGGALGRPDGRGKTPRRG